MRKFWRNLFMFIFIQILFDGFFISFLYPFKIMHFVKDFVLALTFLFFMAQENLMEMLTRLGKSLGPGVAICMTALFIVGVCQIFNPNSPGLSRGLLGLKVMFLYWLLVPLAFAYFESSEGTEKFLKSVVIGSIPVNIFGVIQYLAGPGFMVSHFGPGFAPSSMLAMVPGLQSADESFVRVIGTFTSSSLYGQFLGANIMMGFSLFFSGSRPRILWFGAIVLGIFALLMTGSRGSFLTLVAMFVIFSFLQRRARPAVVGLIVFSIVIGSGLSVLKTSVSKRYATILRKGELSSRTFNTTNRQFMDIAEKYPLGKGIGSATQAARYLGKVEGQYSLIENYPSKLQMEMGLAGVLIYVVFIILLFKSGFSKVREAQFYNPKTHIFMVMAFSYCLGAGISGTFPDAPPAALYIWCFVGMLARLSEVAEIEYFQTEQQDGEQTSNE